MTTESVGRRRRRRRIVANVFVYRVIHRWTEATNIFNPANIEYTFNLRMPHIYLFTLSFEY